MLYPNNIRFNISTPFLYVTIILRYRQVLVSFSDTWTDYLYFNQRVS